MKDIWGIDKFDIVIGNPPFNQMIDMDFVKKSYRISDVILFVHPSTWLLDEKGKQKILDPSDKKKGWILSSLLISVRRVNYFNSKLALLDSCLASAEALSTEVSSP